jgi:predicted nucleic acid-binding protein
MGSLTIPLSGVVAIESCALIYGLDRHPTYGPLVAPVWAAARAGQIDLVASELTITETLVFPLRSGDARTLSDYETALFGSDLRLLPMTQTVLRDAARLRAGLNLRTPDAIHAAAALDAGAALFVTNDPHFRRVPGLPVAVLLDLLP